MVHFAIIKLFASGTWTCVQRVSVLYLNNPTPAQKKRRRKKNDGCCPTSHVTFLASHRKIKDFQQNGRQL